MVINKSKEFESDNYKNIVAGAADLFFSVGNNKKTSLAASNTIQRIVTELVNELKSGEANEAKIRITALKPHNLFDIPRWHIDQSTDKEIRYKIVIVFKGNRTLFYNLPKEKCSEFLKLRNAYLKQRSKGKRLLYYANNMPRVCAHERNAT